MSTKHFFKNIKKNKKGNGGESEFPSNSRAIPATFIKMYSLSLKIFILIIFLLVVATVGVDLQKNLRVKEDIDIQRTRLTQELRFWEDFSFKQQNYRDAYLQASILNYKLGNTSKARMYAEKGLILDPNSQDGKKLEQFLVNK